MTEVPKFNDVKISIRDLLPERDYDRNKAGIVSQVVGKPITVEYQAGFNCAYKSKKGYTIIKASPKAKSIDGNTAINHELAHILFNSFEKKVIRTLNSWAKQWGETAGSGGFGSVYNKGYVDAAFKTYHEALNIIEDQRIESLWGKLYLGNVKEFVRTRKRLGQDLKEVEHPSNMLLAERFYRPDLVQGKYKHVGRMIHNVEGKDLKASLIVLKQIKPYLDETIKKLLDSTRQSEKSQKEFANVPSETPDRDTVLQKILKERQQAIDDIKKYDTVKYNQHRRDHMRHPMEDDDDEDIFEDNELGKEELVKEEESATKKIIEIKDKMSGSGQMPHGKTYVEKRMVDTSRPAVQSINVNNKVVQSMKRLLRQFKEKRKDMISCDGDELDVGEYISMKANGYGECMTDTVRKNGLSICVSIDGSGSMYHHNNTVERIMKTLWQSIEGTDAIDLKCIVWASNQNGDMNIREFTKDNIKWLDKQSGGYTPTHFGIKIGSEELLKMKGERKLLIVITDGYPNYYKRGVKVRGDVTGKETIKAFKLALRQTPNILVLGIGYYLGYMKQMFGNKYISCKGMDHVEEFMMKTFRREVIQVMSK
jgi:hypothetical protein